MRASSNIATPEMAPSTNGTADLNDSAVMAPIRYISTLPSKNIRTKLANALNIWFNIAPHKLQLIKEVVIDLHNSSLILDDIQDDSTLRRGNRTAHLVFGPAQCINSATYMMVHSGQKLQGASQEHPQIFPTWDLKWKYDARCPSVVEYMAMVNGKTGAMFSMLMRMIASLTQTPSAWLSPELDQLMQLLECLFQVRDDYQNLQDETFTEQKDFVKIWTKGNCHIP
ncbi:isoprenoid synthase domain-containing protein [Aspergillus cavernicola]|uniref:Isoprenoid synthase domain-containing protein n=1 Tax=Aspergillus cavernicola TaxID=176166 RepID=A0ABR4IWC4_9EURO